MPILPATIAIELSEASRYADKLLRELGARAIPNQESEIHPAQRWAESGLMALTGRRDDPPELCPVPLPSCADGALAAFRALTATNLLPGVNGGDLLSERAAITGYKRNGTLSLQGHCQLLATRNGTIGLNLARDDDWALLPAWLHRDGDIIDLQTLADEVQQQTTEALLHQGRLLGLAIVDATAIPTEVAPWFAVAHRNPTTPQQRKPHPRVVDLSSLWAGPLCSHLWQLAGAEVIKVESTQRPDGSRTGSTEFFELLNRGKEFVTLDLHKPAGRQALAELIESADIVLEASRPRALRQMGLIAEDFIDRIPGKTWLSLTGYGRKEPQANWIAYGDDAGVVAGLSAIIHQATGQWLICGDAIADPLTGLHAALAGWASWLSGEGRLIDISLQAVVRHCIAATAPADQDYRARYGQWRQYLADNSIAIKSPRRINRSKAP